MKDGTVSRITAYPNHFTYHRLGHVTPCHDYPQLPNSVLTETEVSDPMTLHRLRLTAVMLLLTLATACMGQAPSPPAGLQPPTSEQFAGYWYQGLAELTRYDLSQARYGELREGDAVMVFVTEDFLADTQVKFEGRPTDEARRTVLKLNAMRNFVTGIYPYSIMTSVFSPVDVAREQTLKVTSSTQEWCGMTFMQLNHRGDDYQVRLHSYFQAEADQRISLDDALPEDALWTTVRLDPTRLPLGEIELIPALTHLHLAHKPARVEAATATLEERAIPELGDAPLMVYTVDYHDLDRTLTIVFDAAFPYTIHRWEEAVNSAGTPLVTRATRTHSIQSPYWSKNSVADTTWRATLGLD